MKEEEQLKIEAQALADKKEGDLRKAIESLLGAADMPVDRTSRLRVDSMLDAISFAVDSSDQIQRLLKKTKGALSKLFSLMFPKLDQEKTLEELVNVFVVDTNSTIEVTSTAARAENSLSSATGNESELVCQLRNRIFQIEKDLVGILAMAAVVKKKGELAAEVEQYALDRLQTATESLNFVAFNALEENKRVHDTIEAMTDLSQPKSSIWAYRSKAATVAKFEYRVEKVHYYFDKCHAHLTMVWKTMFPLDPAPLTLLALMTRFKNPATIQALVRKELLAGAELAFAFVLACYPTLDLESIAKANVELDQYYPVARHPTYIIVSRMEAGTERSLQSQTDQGTTS
ncbi:hypothetical protein ACQ4PT_004690 [Festuca glaucescens]